MEFTSENIQKHKELANAIKSGLDVKSNVITEKDPRSAYLTHLPDGVTEKQINALSIYNAKFVTAAHVAVGELAADIFTKNKGTDEVTASVGYFGKHDSIGITVAREKKFQNHLAENPADKEITKHLVMRTDIQIQSGKGAGLKAARASMSEEFTGSTKK